MLSYIKQKGFTLQEMLIVITIMLILIAIGTPIIGNIMTNSDTEEFVSTAKLAEDASHAYYRDNGTYPVGSKTYTSTQTASLQKTKPNTEVAFADSAAISENSRLIIISRLVENGITNAPQVYDELLAAGKFKSISADKLSTYSRVGNDSFGFDNLIIVDLVEADKLGGKYGIYENDIAGHVFSADTRSKTTGITFSGAYDLSDKELSKVLDNAADLDDSSKEDISSKNLYPYGFKVNSITQSNEDAEVKISWTNKFTNEDGDLFPYKGYVGSKYVINVYDENKNIISKYTKTIADGSTSATLTLPVSTYYITIQSTEITYAGSIVSDKVSEKVGLENNIYGEGSPDAESGEGEGDGSGACKLGCPGTAIDLNDKLLGGDSTDGTQDDTVIVDTCDTCNLDEIVGGGLLDGGEIYEKLQESTSFSKNNISLNKSGITLTSLEASDILVLREVKKDGTLLKVNNERTFTFRATSSTVTIPKSPYLQNDFQVNAHSNYIYVLEVFKYKLNTSTGSKLPKNATQIYYK